MLFGPVCLTACERDKHDSSGASSASARGALSGSLRPPGPPALLYLPDGGDVALSPEQQLLPGPGLAAPGRCPGDMVDVRGQFCIDRYEATLIDAQGRSFSPYYPPQRAEAKSILARFRDIEPVMVSPPAMPVLPDWEKREDARPIAQSRQGVVPSGYLSGLTARAVCEAAGKRLCTGAEWEVACRGQQNRQFPYGDSYEQGRCNVFRETHPAAELHGDASRNHLDPRLNLVRGSEGPLLRKTGATADCRSQWGQDGIYDMVGNLDEWIDDPEGTFAGGFFARNTREGCAARVTAHPVEYFDYSLGVRCCR
ncbi:MAG TPA: SUMF1/EgtB/PvdO family nonheme iron enzyme [Polyangiaceae bacterium]|nr:SUMF1/EgtB/PvdO family nonheme iron enzyme [Polyangiaceae bacterium]